MTGGLARRLRRGLFGRPAGASGEIGPRGPASGTRASVRPRGRVPTVLIVLGPVPTGYRLAELLAGRGFEARVAGSPGDGELDPADADLVVTTTPLIGAVRRASAAPIVNLDIFFRAASGAAPGAKARFDATAFLQRLGDAVGGLSSERATAAADPATAPVPIPAPAV